MKIFRWVLVLIIITVLISVFFIWFRPDRNRIILKGTIITPEEVIDPGWIVIHGKEIASVTGEQPNPAGYVEIDTGGIIYPGMINLHDHMLWNAMPRWDTETLFLNRYEWRYDSLLYQEYREVESNLRDEYLCEMNTYSEVRALIGGTTSMLGTYPRLCIAGMVRNLDFSSGFYFLSPLNDPRHIKNTINMPLDPSDILNFLDRNKSEAFLIHLAEGIGPAMEAEFDQLVASGVLTDKTVIIHGIALNQTHFEKMAAENASLIWSPRTNLELYGTTADITSAMEAGVDIAIGPDWAITGSANILDELHVAAEWNNDHLNGFLSPKDLIEMVTIKPAEIAGIDEFVGSISEGKLADLFVVEGDPTKPFQSLLDADHSDIKLVIIDGKPLYGNQEIMNNFYPQGDLTNLEIIPESKSLAVPDFDDTLLLLEDALEEEGMTLAPLIENITDWIPEPLLPSSPIQSQPPQSDQVGWEDSIYFFGENKTICGPVIGGGYVDSREGKPTFLNIGNDYPNIDRLTIIIWGDVKDNFPPNSENFYIGQTICVTGEIISYDGVPNIFPVNGSQIEIQ